MLKIALAQINPIVGDIPFNQHKILDFCKRAKQQSADIIVFPELSLCGYPPEDLLLNNNFIQQNNTALKDLVTQIPEHLIVVLGLPSYRNGDLYNMAVAFKKGEIITRYAKQHLPNYGVFDEKRYFKAGDQTCIITIKNQRCALSICEDLWHRKVSENAKKLGADILLNLNASPYQKNKTQLRFKTIRQNTANLPLVYVNQIGGQDELVFDGRSFVLDKNGAIVSLLDSFSEDLSVVDFSQLTNIITPPNDELSDIYQALVLATKDYVLKNKFTKVLLGLSGGIDSALVLCIAVDAFGVDNVEAIMMPSRYNSEMSLNDAIAQADGLKIQHQTISIESLRRKFLDEVEFLKNTNGGLTEENLQARIRGVILMARSNQTGSMLLTTGNKSEISVGYATLYGDMAGGFAPLKDVYKTTVYQLAKWINRDNIIIPNRVISRPPSAELSFSQTDLDSLPDYDLLDEILYEHIENNKNTNEIIAMGFDESWVQKIITMVKNSEHKRYQSPPGVKISTRNYGKDRRYPITNNYD